jgi:hypothetical protein
VLCAWSPLLQTRSDITGKMTSAIPTSSRRSQAGNAAAEGALIGSKGGKRALWHHMIARLDSATHPRNIVAPF